MPRLDLSRRTVLGALGGGATATVLTACGDDEEPVARPSSAGGAARGARLVATADVPVGSGVILEDPEVVVSQPTKGTFLAFSAVCTHQGCPVGTITGDRILCPCHGSVFSTEDGSVVQGPAEEPLAPLEVAVAGGQVVRA